MKRAGLRKDHTCDLVEEDVQRVIGAGGRKP